MKSIWILCWARLRRVSTSNRAAATPSAAATAATTSAAHGAKNQRTQSPTLSTEIIINTRRFFNNSDNEANPSARMGF